MTFYCMRYASSGKTIVKLAELLAHIDPDVGYSD